MPKFTFTEEKNGRRITVSARDEGQALTIILSRMRSENDTRHVARGTLENQDRRTLGKVSMLTLSRSAQYQPGGSSQWYTVRAAHRNRR